MNFEQLRTFQAVALQSGFSRAAESLYLSQSTVSMQVAALEKELGVKLLERLGRRVVLTDAGDSMLSYATRILSQLDDARRTMAAFRGLEAGELLVAASPTIGSYVVPELFGAFRRLYPGVRLELNIASTSRVVEHVISGKMDLGLVEGRVVEPEVDVVPFQMDQLVLIVPPGHHWCDREFVTVSDLAEEPFLEREPGSGSREIVMGRLAEQGVKIKLALELGSPEAIKRAVRTGLGVAIVSRVAVEAELAAGLLVSVPVSGLQLTRPFQTALHRNKYIAPPLEAFLQLLRNSADHGGQETALPAPVGLPHNGHMNAAC